MLGTAVGFNQNASGGHVGSVEDVANLSRPTSACNHNVSAWNILSVGEMADMFPRAMATSVENMALLWVAGRLQTSRWRSASNCRSRHCCAERGD